MRKLTTLGISTLAILAMSTAIAAPTHAQTATPTPGPGGWRHFGGMMGQHGMMRPGVFGKVTAVSGSTIKVSSMARANMAQTTYTVDASQAKIMKNNAAGSISDIAVGDTIIVQGTVSGTNVSATAIRDGQFQRQPGANPKAGLPFNGAQGNGQPIIAGTITAVSGSSLTLTNKGNTSYTIDVSNAKVSKDGQNSTASAIAVNDSVIVQGTVNGTTVTAVSVIDHSQLATTPAPNGTNPNPAPRMNFFGRIGQFFAHIFGF